MQCPMCGQATRPKQQECACGELLTQWQTIASSGRALRQRGLAQAGQRDYVGALASFLEAALTNPGDGGSVVDAARSLALLDRPQDALRLLVNADVKGQEADTLKKALHTAVERRKKKPAVPQQQVVVASAVVPPPKPPAPESASAPPPPAAAAGNGAAPAPDAANETNVRFLALGPVERSQGGLARFKGKKQLPDGWSTALAMEMSWPGDWGSLSGWLAAALQHSHEKSLFYYLLGLAQWQQGHPDRAATFDRCLGERPPVLNPAVYYLYLHLDSAEAARKAGQRLGNWVEAKELAECKRVLHKRLDEWRDTERAKVLDALR